jgi:predicted RND superfamily exporter protein
MSNRFAVFATDRPRLVFWFCAVLVAMLGAQIPRIHIDTDPENMLPTDDAQRVFHNEVEERFALHDAIVVGTVERVRPKRYLQHALA